MARSIPVIVKITREHQDSLPARVLEALGVGPGGQLELSEGPDGFILRPRHIDYSRLGTLRDKIPLGHPTFDIETFRERL